MHFRLFLKLAIAGYWLHREHNCVNFKTNSFTVKNVKVRIIKFSLLTMHYIKIIK